MITYFLSAIAVMSGVITVLFKMLMKQNKENTNNLVKMTEAFITNTATQKSSLKINEEIRTLLHSINTDIQIIKQK